MSEIERPLLLFPEDVACVYCDTSHAKSVLAWANLKLDLLDVIQRDFFSRFGEEV